MKVSVAWLCFVLLRLLWTCAPQTGYIHPDEFFQTVEVVAGDVLGLDVHRTWEFNSTYPLRSIVLPHLTCGPPLYLLSHFSHLDLFQHVRLLDAYALLALPRLVVTLLSIVTDLLVMGLARRLGFDSNPVVLLYATSYVTLVYYTRTLTNTFESFLFVLLLYFTMTAVPSDVDTRQRANKHLRKPREAHLNLPPHNTLPDNTFAVALTMVAGFFNRPTFLAFAFVPLAGWIFQRAPGYRQKTHSKEIIQRLFYTGMYTVLLASAFILCDSIYYGTLMIGLDVTRDLASGIALFFSKLTITPLNFLRYNTDTSKLAEHGIHLRITHYFVNLPLLYAVLAVLLTVELATTVRNCLVKRQHREKAEKKGTNLPVANPLRLLLLCAVLVPVLLLSVFPHQEPRFLIPLLPLMCLLYGTRIFGSHSGYGLQSTWFLFNVLAALFYGCLHQGGLYPCLRYIQNSHIESRETPSVNHVVFYHTYMPPKYLLAVTANGTSAMIKSGLQNPTVNNTSVLRLHDLKGSSTEDLIKTISTLAQSPHDNESIYLVTPSSLAKMVNSLEAVEATFQNSFGPHLSTEDLPEFGSTNCSEGSNNRCLDTNHGIFSRIFSALSLDLYRVKMKL